MNGIPGTAPLRSLRDRRLGSVEILIFTLIPGGPTSGEHDYKPTDHHGQKNTPYTHDTPRMIEGLKRIEPASNPGRLDP